MKLLDILFPPRHQRLRDEAAEMRRLALECEHEARVNQSAAHEYRRAAAELEREADGKTRTQP